MCLRATRGQFKSVAFSKDGTRIISGGLDKSVLVWDASTGEEVIEGHTRTKFHSSVSKVVDTELTSRISNSGPLWIPRPMIISNDGLRIVSWERSVQSPLVMDATTCKVLNVLEGHTDYIGTVAFSNDGTRIVSGSMDQSLHIWDASMGEMQNLVGSSGIVYTVAFSNNGERIVMGCQDRFVQVWNASTGEVQNLLKGHTMHVSSVAFSNDGTQIVSASEDKSVRVWDAITGEVKNVLEGHLARVFSVAFSNDDTQIVSKLSLALRTGVEHFNVTAVTDILYSTGDQRGHRPYRPAET